MPSFDLFSTSKRPRAILSFRTTLTAFVLRIYIQYVNGKGGKMRREIDLSSLLQCKVALVALFNMILTVG
jgi:hypothetical protein